jgi:hypothetical protein
VLSNSTMAVSFHAVAFDDGGAVAFDDGGVLRAPDRRANGFAGRPLEGALEAGERSCA